VTKVNYQNL